MTNRSEIVSVDGCVANVPGRGTLGLTVRGKSLLVCLGLWKHKHTRSNFGVSVLYRGFAICLLLRAPVVTSGLTKTVKTNESEQASPFARVQHGVHILFVLHHVQVDEIDPGTFSTMLPVTLSSL